MSKDTTTELDTAAQDTVPTEVRLEIDVAFQKLSLILSQTLSRSEHLQCGLKRIMFHKIEIKPNMTAKQVHHALAHIGMAYMVSLASAELQVQSAKKELIKRSALKN